MTIAQEILQNAIAVVCDADFYTRYPNARENIDVPLLIDLYNKCEVS